MQKGKPHWWDEANKFLLQDDLLGPIVKQHQGETLVGKGDLFATFVNSIVGQQISVKAANAVWGKMVNANVNTPNKILSASDVSLREVGLSRQKISYSRDLAEKIKSG